MRLTPTMIAAPLTALALAISALSAPAQAQGKAAAMTDAQKQAVEQIVREYLTQNPEVVVDAIKVYRERQEKAEEARNQAALQTHRAKLFDDASTPIGGNPKGDVTIVEFFDYRCGYCKRAFPSVQELLKSDGNIRYVYKELPILGEQSMFASRAALAGFRADPKKYEAFRGAMMSAQGALTEERVLRLAKESGYDPAALKKGMAAPEVQAMISENYKLAENLGITGTPAFVIGDQLVPGAVSVDTMRELVAKARKG